MRKYWKVSGMSKAGDQDTGSFLEIKSSTF